MRLNERISSLKPSVTLELNQKAKALQAAGRPVLNLTAGEPDFPTPERIRRAAVAAIERGETRYTATSGIVPLRDAILKGAADTYGRSYRRDEVIVTSGAKQALFNAAQVLLNDGDEAVIVAPYWISYIEMVRAAGAVARIVDAEEGTGFVPSAAEIERAFTPKTRLLMVNSPSNPTGAVFPPDLLREIALLVRKRPDVVVLTDDIYEKFLYDGAPFASVAMERDLPAEQLVIVNGVSKTYAMTGWRIGFALGPKSVVSAMDILQSASTSNAASPSQWAAVEALTGDQSDVETMRHTFEARRDAVHRMLSEIPGVTTFRPQGAFYLFPNVRRFLGRKDAGGKSVRDDVQLAEYLLEGHGVAVVPGSAFGRDGYLRVSFAASDEALRNGVQKLREGLLALRD
jgi:aspartate aminotransferase